MKECYLCGGKLILTKDLVIKNGKSFPIEVEMCKNCGETFSDLKETIRVKKELYPSFLGKIKNIFSSKNIELSWMRGRVL